MTHSKWDTMLHLAESKVNIQNNIANSLLLFQLNDFCFVFADYLKDVANLRKSYHHKVGKGIFYIYGDSLSYYHYLDVKGVNRTLCTEVFQSCSVSYNWIYPKTLYEMVRNALSQYSIQEYLLLDLLIIVQMLTDNNWPFGTQTALSYIATQRISVTAYKF